MSFVFVDHIKRSKFSMDSLKGSFDHHFRVAIKFLKKKTHESFDGEVCNIDLKRWNDKDRRIVNIHRDERASNTNISIHSNVRFETFEFPCFSHLSFGKFLLEMTYIFKLELFTERVCNRKHRIYRIYNRWS